MRTEVALFAALLVVGRGAAQQRAVDVERYRFSITIPDTGSSIFGTTVVYAHWAAGADSLRLDLVGLEVPFVRDAVTSNAVPFQYDGRILSIPLPVPPTTRAGFVVTYSGVPRDGLIIGRDARGRRVIFGDNWPTRARYWLPTVDDPADKAEIWFAVTTPRGLRVVSNGLPFDAEHKLWTEDHPIPTYTMVFGAAEFTVSQHRPVVHGRDTIPIQVWAYAEDSAFADSVPFKNATEIVETMERLIGPFPYEKLAHVESSTKFGGMENASAIFYAERPYVERRMGEGVVRHETAHQWFGDAVTPRHFHHLWLSEGFASYFDLVVGAALHGDSLLTAGMRRAAEGYFASNVVDRPILDTTVTDYLTLLNANNYPKGAWVLHMLRGLVGDSVFFRGCREYYRRYRDSTALSDDFRAVMEQTTGRDLQWFFQQWLRQPGYPQLDVAWRPDGAGRIRLDVTQTQLAAWGRFRLPRLTIEFRAADGRTLRRIYSVEGNVSILFADLPFVPAVVTVDPDGALLLKATVRR
jgi:aminopeptidase N